MGTDEVMVGMPWRPQHTRLAAFERTKAFYEGCGLEVVTADSGHSNFNISATRNILVSELLSRAKVIVLADADTTVSRLALKQAIEEALLDDLVHLPYHLYRDTSGVYTPGATSGVYVTSPAAWWSTGGQDELFEGWGYEDTAWRLAHLTLNGPVVQHYGTAVAELHTEAPRNRLAPNRDRYRMYQRAFGDPILMRHLVTGGSLGSPGSRRDPRRVSLVANSRYSRPHQ